MPPNRRRRMRSSVAGRLTEGSASTAEPYERSSEYYFDDGNIVLVAEKTAFRVHRGQMAQHSTIFQALFEAIDKSDEVETFDDCSVVKLTDRNIDLRRLLRAMYDILHLDPEDTNQLFGVLRMAHKYLIKCLREHVCDILRRAYPDKLEQWDEHSGLRPSVKHVISLAHATDTTILLPAAFYHLCTLPPKAATQKPNMKMSDLSNFYRGKEQIAYLWAGFIDELLENFRGIICGEEECAEEWSNEMDRLQKGILESVSFTSPTTLERLDEFWKFADKSGLLCEECREYAKEAAKEKRAEIWDALPKIFGLGSWAELRRD